MLKLLNDSKYFDIVIRALSECFTELNINHKIVTNIEYDSEDTYIICTTHEPKALPKNYISYNFEQLSTDKKWDISFFARLKSAKCVWDYSLLNIEVLKSYNISAIHLPLGYAKCMDHNHNHNNQKTHIYDFMFIGCLNEKRLKMLNPLLELYYKKQEKLLINNSCWGSAMEDAFKKTKIGINMHYYGGKTILEIHRIIPLIANRVWVLSEHSDDTFYENQYNRLVTFYDNKHDLVKKGLKILKKSKNEYESETKQRYEYLITNCKYIDYIKAANLETWLM